MDFVKTVLAVAKTVLTAAKTVLAAAKTVLAAAKTVLAADRTLLAAAETVLAAAKTVLAAARTELRCVLCQEGIQIFCVLFGDVELMKLDPWEALSFFGCTLILSKVVSFCSTMFQSSSVWCGC